MDDNNEVLREIRDTIRDLRVTQQEQTKELNHTAIRMERVVTQMEQVTRMNCDLASNIERVQEHESRIRFLEELAIKHGKHDERITKLESGYLRLTVAVFAVIGVFELVGKVITFFRGLSQ